MTYLFVNNNLQEPEGSRQHRQANNEDKQAYQNGGSMTLGRSPSAGSRASSQGLPPRPQPGNSLSQSSRPSSGKLAGSRASNVSEESNERYVMKQRSV